VLYALAHPLSLVLLLISFVVGMTLHGWIQSLVAERLGDNRLRQEGRLKPDPQRQVDPIGSVAAALSGLGWVRPVDLPDRRRRGALWMVALSGPLVNIGLGLGLLLALRFGYGRVPVSDLSYFLQHGLPIPSSAFGEASLLLIGGSQLYLGVLSLIPLPPLDGGRLLFALAPVSQGWQKARYHLIEQNIGVAITLVLLIIPLGSKNTPLLLFALDKLLQVPLKLVLGG
jgi:Zn-dependent protease